jgi:hypothetical protein
MQITDYSLNYVTTSCDDSDEWYEKTYVIIIIGVVVLVLGSVAGFFSYWFLCRNKAQAPVQSFGVPMQPKAEGKADEDADKPGPE